MFVRVWVGGAVWCSSYGPSRHGALQLFDSNRALVVVVGSTMIMPHGGRPLLSAIVKYLERLQVSWLGPGPSSYALCLGALGALSACQARYLLALGALVAWALWVLACFGCLMMCPSCLLSIKQPHTVAGSCI